MLTLHGDSVTHFFKLLVFFCLLFILFVMVLAKISSFFATYAQSCGFNFSSRN